MPFCPSRGDTKTTWPATVLKRKLMRPARMFPGTVERMLVLGGIPRARPAARVRGKP